MHILHIQTIVKAVIVFVFHHICYVTADAHVWHVHYVWYYLVQWSFLLLKEAVTFTPGYFLFIYSLPSHMQLTKVL